MKHSVRFWMFSLVLVLTMALAACGQQQPAAPRPAAPAGGGSAGGGAAGGGDASGGSEASGGVTLEIGIKGEELAFDKDTMEATAPEGEEITIDFENTSQTQEHNFVLFSHNDMAQAETFNEEAMAAVDTSYYPEDNDELTSDVIVHIETLQPGENGSASFESPGPGEYLYICTVPGHFAAGDYGVLTIQ